ncbi:MAG: bifunctional heptose 7-phosphate kinase/heptose 1-phosphate adenyltransferase [Parachlamydiaceae bacterium]
MVKLLESFNDLKAENILVVGDLLLDAYTIGKARRISPEAPVPVIHVYKEESRPGGAGNAVLNMVSLGAKVTVLGRIGNDHTGELLLKELEEEGVNVQHVIVQHGYQTPLKNRVIADNQQIVRVDHESYVPLNLGDEMRIVRKLPHLLEGIKAIAISDYGKGFLTLGLLRKLIEEALKRRITVVVDPKGTDFTKYEGAFLIKPNLSEAYAAAHLPSEAALEEVARKLLTALNISYLMITRSESGISLFDKMGQRKDFPVKAKEVKDVTGAGDTVLAMITCALASNVSLDAAIPLSNIAAGIAIEHIGCARVGLADVAKRLLSCDVENKIFGVQHLEILKCALKDRECISLSLTSDHMSKELILAMHRLKTNHQRLIISLESPMPEEEFIRSLASLYQVDFIVLNPTKELIENSLHCKSSYTFDHRNLLSLTRSDT